MSDEDTQNEEPDYTVDVNGKRYELNEDIRQTIQERAKREYAENYQFSCWWKVENGDPILVIETEGPMVPWERLDQLGVEMQDPSGGGSGGGNTQDRDHSNGMAMMPKDDDDAPSKDDGQDESNRTHFDITPSDYEELPSPDGEDENKVPQKPEDFDEPTLVKWVPEHPEIEHTWEAGEAITSMFNWVEWDVQKYVDQPRPASGKPNGHDHWESMLESHDCEKVKELGPSQNVPGDSPRQSKKEQEDIGPKYGGDNWQI